jgi:hypothetical protein
MNSPRDDPWNAPGGCVSYVSAPFFFQQLLAQFLAADRKLSPLFVRQSQSLALELLRQYLVLRAQIFDRFLLARACLNLGVS